MTRQEHFRLVNAVGFARELGTPLTAFVTITWNRRTGFKLADWADDETRLWNKASNWLLHRGIQPVRVLVRENTQGRGPHSHWMVHLPPSQWRALKPRLEAYLQKAGGFWDPTAVKITGGPNAASGMVTQAQQFGVVRYLSKSLNPEEFVMTSTGRARLVNLLDIRPEYQAGVPLKRVGASECIGPTARARAGWQDVVDVPAIARMINPESRALTKAATPSRPTSLLTL